MAGTSTALATIAIVNSNIAASEAARANRIACTGNINSFDSKNASVQEMKVYSKCVQMIYPDLMSESQIIAGKILFNSALIGAVIGVYITRKKCYKPDWVDYAFGAFFGFVGIPLALCAIIALCAGIHWLFT